MNLLRKKYFEYLVALAAYFITSLLVLGGVLLSPGTIGFFHDWFIGPFPEMNNLWATNGLYVWDSQIGNKLYGTDWIIRLILVPVTFLGGEALSKGLVVLSMTLSGFGAFCLGRRLNLNYYVSFGTGVLYIFSPIIFTRIVAGHVYYLIAYFLTPIILESFLKAKEKNNNRYFVISGLLLSLAAIQIQFIPMIILILLIFTLIDFRRIKKSMIGLVITISVTFLISLSPILLSQLVVEEIQSPFNPTQLLSYHTVITASDLAESFRMLGYEGIPYSYLNLGTSNDLLASNLGILPSWIFYLDFLFPIAGFSILLFRRDKHVISLALVSIIGLYLLKGFNPPFPGIFSFLFLHGLYIFRELWHIAFLYSFSMTFLIGFLIKELCELNLKPLRISLTKPFGISLTKPLRISLSMVLISMIVVSNGYPLLLGNFGGYVQTYNFDSDYRTLYNTLLSNPQYNVLILPYVNPVRYDNLTLQGIDPLVSHASSMIFPMILGTGATSTHGFSTWLLSSLQENKINNLGRLLTGFGIKYVVLRNEFVSVYPNYTPLGLEAGFREKWNAPLESTLDRQKDMKVIADTSRYKIYENLDDANKIFLLEKSAGGLTNFDTLDLISNLTSLSNVALYPSISLQDSIIFLDNVQEANMPVNDFLDIGKYTSTFDANIGWTDSRNWFGYDHSLASRVHDGAFSNSHNSQISFEIPTKYNKKEVAIWLKALVWNQGGTVTVINNEDKYSVSLFSPDKSFQLFKIFDGKLETPHDISIQNIHGRNYVEGLYVKEKQSQQFNFTDKTVLANTGIQKENNLLSNSAFSLKDNVTKLPLYWYDKFKSCEIIFRCKITRADGWDDKESFQISTTNNTNDTWSQIYGKEVEIQPHEEYELLVHMKLNRQSTQSHVVFEGFNETSKRWYQIKQCPSGTDGPLDWSVEICNVKSPPHVTKIRSVLNAGWSSDSSQMATTWFDAVSIKKLPHENQTQNIGQSKKLILSMMAENNSLLVPASHNKIDNYNKINPTIWSLHINTSTPTTIGFAEPYDHRWKATLYKDGKKIDLIKSMPLYGSINSFQVRETGDLDITLEFETQHWYEIGLLISSLTFSLCIIYILYDFRKNKIVNLRK